MSMHEKALKRIAEEETSKTLNPTFEKIADGLYICHDEELLREAEEEERGNRFISYQELCQNLSLCR